jgi:hypothetical protein
MLESIKLDKVANEAGEALSLERISQQSLSLSQWLTTTIKASDAKQQ